MGFEWCLEKLGSLLRRRSAGVSCADGAGSKSGRSDGAKTGRGSQSRRIVAQAARKNACDEVQSKGTVRRKGVASAVSHPPTQIGSKRNCGRFRRGSWYQNAQMRHEQTGEGLVGDSAPFWAGMRAGRLLRRSRLCCPKLLTSKPPARLAVLENPFFLVPDGATAACLRPSSKFRLTFPPFGPRAPGATCSGPLLGQGTAR